MKPLLAQLKVELILASRRGENLLVTIFIPLGLLFFFASVMTPAGEAGSSLDFLVPGILALAIVSSSMVSLGIATAYERYYGVLKRLLGSPLPRSSLLIAKTLSVLAIELVQIVLVLAIAIYAYGYRPAGSLPLAVLVLAIGSVAFAGLGLLMAGLLRAEATLAGANGLYLVFLLTGGFVWPVDRLPGIVADIARLSPASAFSEAVRLSLGADQSGLMTPLLVITLWAAVLGIAAARTFRAE